MAVRPWYLQNRLSQCAPLEKVPDAEFFVTRRALTTEFYTLDLIENIYREYLWLSGFGADSWTWNRPKEVIAMIHDSLRKR